MTESTKQDAPRLRLASDIDFSKAKPSCKNCNGTGRSGTRSIDNPENKGEVVSVQVVCKCVTHGGGVKEDQLDKMVKEMIEQMKDGIFAKTLSDDIMGLPIKHRYSAIKQLEADSNDNEKLPECRKAATEALEEIKKRIKESSHGDA